MKRNVISICCENFADFENMRLRKTFFNVHMSGFNYFVSINYYLDGFKELEFVGIGLENLILKIYNLP